MGRHNESDVRGCVNLIPDSFIFARVRHFNWEKINKIWAVGKFFAHFYAGTRKSLQNFWPPLLQQPIKFVLTILFSSSCHSSVKRMAGTWGGMWEEFNCSIG